MEQSILEKIEALRHQMVEEALEQGSFTHGNVVAISQKLDKYIVFYHKLKKSSKAIKQHEQLAVSIGTVS